MICATFCVYRRPGLTEQEFHGYWRDVHGPKVAAHQDVLGFRRYVQHHAVHAGISRALGASRGGREPFDGVAQVFFDDLDALRSSGSTPEARAAADLLIADEAEFIDFSRSVISLTEDIVVVP
ncbi:MAG: EthD domain-containing protein [Aeromicrobium sp.]